MKLKIVSVLAIALVALVGGYFGYVHLAGQKAMAGAVYPITTSSDFVGWESDVVGTHSGTSTTFVLFSNATNNVTSSYITRIGRDKTLAVYRLRTGPDNSFTSSTSNLNFQVLGSNDFGCDSNTTTVGAKAPTTTNILMSDISWSSAMDHLLGRVHSTSFSSAASSTLVIPWTNPSQKGNQEIILSNLDYECLMLQVSGASSSLWAGVTTKKQ